MGRVRAFLARRRPPPSREPITLTRRRIYILPTRQGMFFVLVLLAMLLGSMNYTLGLGFAFVFLLAGLGLVSLLHVFGNLSQLVIAPGRAEPVFAGGVARFPMTVDNPLGRVRLDVAMALPDGVASRGDVPAFGMTRLSVSLPAARRGVLPLPRFHLYTRYPLGLFRAWSYLHFDVHCLVYPRPEQGGPPPPRQGQGQGRVDLAGQGSDDFAGFRNYQPGDPPRHVDWKAVARGRGLHVKRFAMEVGEAVRLDLRQVAGMEREQALSRLCRWVVELEEEGAAYALDLAGEAIPPGSGPAHRHRCLAALARFGLTDPP